MRDAMSAKATRISVTRLRKKFPHPVRGLQGQFTGYCVAGALCSEVGMVDCEFPNQVQLRDALLKATGAQWYEIEDAEAERIWNDIAKVIALNDIGEFESAWKTLGVLIRELR